MLSSTDLLIVGGGFSGVALGANIVSKRPETRIVVARDPKRPPFGIAYETDCPLHLLNVPAKGMSAFADQLTHFIDWSVSDGTPFQPNDFAPRRTYRRYLEHVWNQQKLKGSVEEVREEVISLCRSEGKWLAEFSSGDKRSFSLVALSFGAFPPDPFKAAEAVESDRRYHSDPWQAVDPLVWTDSSHVGIIGTGLTAVDVVLSGESLGWNGHYTMLSRSGRLSQVHDLSTPPLDPHTIPAPNESVRQLLRELKQASLKSALEGSNWRAVIDGMRPNNWKYWQTLSERDRERFLTHLRSFWEIHRHRMAPEIAERLDELQRQGRLTILKGKVDRISPVTNGIQVSSGEQDLRFDQLYNCTGPTGKVSSWPSKLIQQLIRDQVITLDSGCRGINFESGGWIDSPESGLCVIGHPRKGLLWESTAVPELRVQAANLAQEIVAQFTIHG